MANKKGIFITATDTGAGKTLVAALVARLLVKRGLKAALMKPVASGCRLEGGRLVSGDLEFYRKAGLPVEDNALACPVMLREPLSPNVAAAAEGKEIDIAKIVAAFDALSAKSDFVVVEGIGGLLVPLAGRFTVADLIAKMKLPALVVAANRLGVINHAALTVSEARRRGIEVKGIILNAVSREADPSRRCNKKAIEEMTGCPVLCELGFHEDVARGDINSAFAEFEKSFDAEGILR